MVSFGAAVGLSLDFLRESRNRKTTMAKVGEPLNQSREVSLPRRQTDGTRQGTWKRSWNKADSFQKSEDRYGVKYSIRVIFDLESFLSSARILAGYSERFAWIRP